MSSDVGSSAQSLNELTLINRHIVVILADLRVLGTIIFGYEYAVEILIQHASSI